MKKNIAIVVLIIFCGLFLLYAFQQKTFADKNMDQTVQLQLEAHGLSEQLAQCKDEAAKQAEMAKVANIEAQRQKLIAEKQAELVLEATNASK